MSDSGDSITNREMMMPVLFVSHENPLNAIEETPFAAA
jgi:aromatic ring-opening dioxygenase catalytic subunit (LigB family)